MRQSFIILKIVFLQLFWYVVVLKCNEENSNIFLLASLFICLINYFLFHPAFTFKRYFIFTIFITLFGAFHDWALISSHAISKESYLAGHLSLWVVFVCYYNDIFKSLMKQSKRILAIIGGIGGSFAYWCAFKLNAIDISPDHSVLYFLGVVFLLWAMFFPFSLRVYMLDSFLDTFLDKTILFSFNRSGFERHQKEFTETFTISNTVRSSTKRAIITGGTSGIGAAVAQQLSALGIDVEITGRNELKGKQFASEFKNMNFIKLDGADWSDLLTFSKNCESFDYVVLNAGAMLENLELNAQKVESQCASQLIGHYLLIHFLKTQKKLNPGARIVWVSSGGLYLKKLDLDSLFNNINYEKVSTYANVKRAQVTLVEELANIENIEEFNHYSMHPGWVDTTGLSSSLPQFFHLMKKNLRTPKQGSDTIIWLLLTQSKLTPGGFYFDRKKVLPYFWSIFNPTLSQRALLMERVEYFKNIN